MTHQWASGCAAWRHRRKHTLTLCNLSLHNVDCILCQIVISVHYYPMDCNPVIIALWLNYGLFSRHQLEDGQQLPLKSSLPSLYRLSLSPSAGKRKTASSTVNEKYAVETEALFMVVLTTDISSKDRMAANRSVKIDKYVNIFRVVFFNSTLGKT